MHNAACGFKWPHGPLPWIVLFVYGLVALIWFESHGGLPTWLPHEWAEHLPGRDMLGYGIIVVFGANACEGLACCYILHKRLRFHVKALIGWFWACTLLGYPVACLVLAIKRADTQGKLKRL
mmetsp:Transcript_51946/g.70858  ORF Transcript_51946/g.70858 Transcript_51946/m.70858 type:complete len:122 (-) Transcript_51946:282-647(-)